MKKAAPKLRKVRRFTEGGTVPENRDFKDTSKTDDLEDTDTGGFVRDSSGNRVRGTYAYLTWGEGPSKRTKPAAAAAAAAAPVKAPNSSPARQKVEIYEEEPYGVPPPPKPNAEKPPPPPVRPLPNAGRTPAIPKVPEAPPQRAKVDVSDEDPLGSISPINEPPGPPSPPLPIKVPPSPRFPPRPIYPAPPPEPGKGPALSAEGSKPNRGPALPPPKDNKVKLPGPAKVVTTFNDQGRKALSAPPTAALPAPPKAALPAPPRAALPAPTPAQLAAEQVRLKAINLPLQPVETLPPFLTRALALARMGAGGVNKLLENNRTPQRPPEAKLELPAPKANPALPSPAKSTAVAKREVTAESANARPPRPPRPIPGRPDSDDKEEQRQSLAQRRKKKEKDKPKTYATGGSVGASRRADGCAQRGKTRGRIS